MVTINTTDDLIRLLRDDPAFLAAVQRELFTQELLALPERFAAYSAATDKKLDALTSDVGTLKTDSGSLKCLVFQATMEKSRLPRMVSQFGLRNIRIVRLAEYNRASQEFNDAVWDALDDGLISKSEHDRLMLTDMIVRGRVGKASQSFTWYSQYVLVLQNWMRINRVDPACVGMTNLNANTR